MTKKEKRLKYLGFNDVWFAITGILVLGILSAYVLNPTLAQLNPLEVAASFVVAVFFSTCDWIINRRILIHLRKTYPDLTDSVKRIILLLLGTTMTVVAVDFLGANLFVLLSDRVHYVFEERIRSLVIIVGLTTMTMAIYEAVYFFVLLKKSIRQEEQAKQAIIQAQLDALQNQIQPHFFFNTLNTLRDIIDQNPKADAMNFVDKLSDIYRFLLETGNTKVTTLQQELKFAKAYIHVQSERFGDNLQLHWDIPEVAKASFVVPMSLQLLLENAIKHNIISRSKPLEINVKVEEHQLVVANKIQKKSTQLPSTKVGLKNIKKRYALISNQSVEVVDDGHQFSVSLPLLKDNTLKEGV